ncbi:MAG: UMP kinase [Halococcoides sp.]
MNTVLSLGGSVLAADLDPDRFQSYGTLVADLAADHRVGVVTGGGPTARDYIEAARELGADETDLDGLGVAVTRLNARLLIAAVGSSAHPTVVEEIDRAREVIRRGDVPIMGGTVAGHTTDAVAASLAEAVDADRLVLGTSVDGVYSGDPAGDDAVDKFDRIAADDLVALIADIGLDAGSNAPVDLLAAKMIQRSGIETVVCDGSDPAIVRAAATDGDHDGTIVEP